MEAGAEDVLAWVRAVWPGRDWEHAEILHGIFHEVAVAAPYAVPRVAHGNDHEERVGREADVLRIAAGLSLPFAVPVPLSEPVSRRGRSGELEEE